MGLEEAYWGGTTAEEAGITRIEREGGRRTRSRESGTRSPPRPMTKAEKEQLGRLIKKLPEKALDHAVQIIQHGGNLSKGHPSQVFVDLEKQDDMTLWRLQYYAHSILKVNKLSNCNPIPLPLI
ncbi:hypothetical protein KSP40_PGU016226 [Platanthera guangdongensis]|uniref:NET domain-containing protein n=1 Tax=Platanthera guangdongensis TaxID=2320717 RepID=A0ABR2MM02_9ASPA